LNSVAANVYLQSDMKVHINGEAHELPEPLTLAGLVEQTGLQGDRVAVELNREIVPRSRWPETVLHDQDRLEIVHFVGGG
jgi:sulfur carrier protein